MVHLMGVMKDGLLDQKSVFGMANELVNYSGQKLDSRWDLRLEL